MKKNISKPYSLVFQYFLLTGILFLCLHQNLAGQQTTLMNGKHTVFYKNGAAKEQGYYNNGEKHKTWYYYQENGVIEKKEKWKNGILQWQLFYKKGRMIRSIDKNGKIKERPDCGC